MGRIADLQEWSVGQASLTSRDFHRPAADHALRIRQLETRRIDATRTTRDETRAARQIRERAEALP